MVEWGRPMDLVGLTVMLCNFVCDYVTMWLQRLHCPKSKDVIKMSPSSLTSLMAKSLFIVPQTSMCFLCVSFNVKLLSHGPFICCCDCVVCVIDGTIWDSGSVCSLTIFCKDLIVRFNLSVISTLLIASIRTSFTASFAESRSFAMSHDILDVKYDNKNAVLTSWTTSFCTSIDARTFLISFSSVSHPQVFYLHHHHGGN